MAYREFEGKSEAEAVEKACIELGVPQKSLRYDVLSHGSTGIFGIVKVRNAKIRVKVDEAPAGRKAPAGEKPVDVAESAPAQDAAEKSGGEKRGRRRGKKTQAPQEEAQAPEKAAEKSPGKSSRGGRSSGRGAKEPKEKAPAAPEERPAVDAGAAEPTQSPSAWPTRKSRSSRSRRKRKEGAGAKGSDSQPAPDLDAASLPDSPEGAPARSVDSVERREEASIEMDPEALAAASEQAREILARLARSLMDAPLVSVEASPDGDILLKADGPDAANLIGRKGQTLDAVQHLLETIVNRERKPRVRIRVDAGDYLARREENLVKLAQRLGDKVKKSGRPASFSPMPAYERRIIHLALKDDPGLRTQSKGSGELRKLIIMPRKEPQGEA